MAVKYYPETARTMENIMADEVRELMKTGMSMGEAMQQITENAMRNETTDKKRAMESDIAETR